MNAVGSLDPRSQLEGSLPSEHLPPSGARPGRTSFPEQPPCGQTAVHLTRWGSGEQGGEDQRVPPNPAPPTL